MEKEPEAASSPDGQGPDAGQQMPVAGAHELARLALSSQRDASAQDSDAGPGPSSLRPGDAREVLRAALVGVGLDEDAAGVFCDAALVVGAVSRGRSVGGLQLGPARAAEDAAATATPSSSSTPSSSARGLGAAPGPEHAAARPRGDAAPGSVEACLSGADVALTAMEAIAAASMRLDAALVVTAAEQATGIGAALLAQRDVTDPGELSVTAR